MGEAHEEGKEKVSGYLLDTHIWLWVMRGDRKRVSARFFAELEEWQRRRMVHLSPYSCWEIGLLVKTNQYQLDRSLEAVWSEYTVADGFAIAELTGPILYNSSCLPGDLHKDPADRILVATARDYDLTFITSDWRILDYAKQGHVKARKP